MAVLHVHEFGSRTGEPVLALHGITAHGRRFRRLAEEAWPERRTIAVDLRGHGRSTYEGPWSISQHVADLLETLDSLEVSTVDLVGHSYGGAIGLALVDTAPEVVRRFVMLDPALAQPGDFATEMALKTIADPGWSSIEEATIARNGDLGPDINPGVREDIAEHLVCGDDGRYRFRHHKPAVVTGWGEVCYPLPRRVTKCPTLLVIADKAELVTPDIEGQLGELFGDHLRIVHIDSDHMLYWERFDETAAAVTAFLDAT